MRRYVVASFSEMYDVDGSGVESGHGSRRRRGQRHESPLLEEEYHRTSTSAAAAHKIATNPPSPPRVCHPFLLWCVGRGTVTSSYMPSPFLPSLRAREHGRKGKRRGRERWEKRRKPILCRSKNSDAPPLLVPVTVVASCLDPPSQVSELHCPREGGRKGRPGWRCCSRPSPPTAGKAALNSAKSFVLSQLHFSPFASGLLLLRAKEEKV